MTEYSAYDVRQILARFVTKGNQAAFDKDEFTFNMFKYFFGFQVNQGKAILKWATPSSHRKVVGSTRTGEVIWYVTADGGFYGLNASTGDRVHSTSPVGEAILGATFDVTSLAPNQQDALTTIANDPDTRFPLAKRFSIDALAVVGGAGVGRLLRMITSKESSKELRTKAANDLIAHPDEKGLPLYLDLLKRPWDYLAGTRPRAVTVMAQVIGKLKAKEAVEHLIRVLQHPLSSNKELLACTNALLAIGDKRAVRPFREFLLAYHADPEFAQDIHPLHKMAEGVFKLGGPQERQVLTFVAEDGKTLPRLRQYVIRMLKETRKGSASK